jgi:hypothetical protein
MVRVKRFFVALRDAVILVLFYFLILVGLVLLAALLGWEYVEKLARPYPLLSTFVIVAGTVGFAISMAAETLRDAEGEGSPLIKVRLISLASLFCFALWLGAVIWAAFRPDDKFAIVRMFTRSSKNPLPDWAYLIRLKILLTFGLVGAGGLIYCLKRKSKIWYGVFELLFAAAANWALSDKILEDIGKHHVAAQDCIGIVAAFYVFTRGVGNLVEGLEENQKGGLSQEQSIEPTRTQSAKA